MSASTPPRRQDIAAPGQHGNFPAPFYSSYPGELTLRTVIAESNRTKAELWQYYSITNWNLNVIASYVTGPEGIALIGRLQPEVLFTSLQSSELNPREYLAQLRASAPAAKIVLFSTLCTEYLVHTLRGANYQGFIYEPAESLESLTHMIHQIRCGERAVSNAILRCQAKLRSDPLAFPKLLSERHQEVLVCIAHSMSDEEIGRLLGFTSATALSHRQRIMQKLGIHSTPKLIRYCIEKGFNSVLPPVPRASVIPA